RKPKRKTSLKTQSMLLFKKLLEEFQENLKVLKKLKNSLRPL
ncbi:15674_t:CDS:1, partial [Gigaspora rosea]